MPTALITGSNRGLGIALVRTALAQGWRVLATVRPTADTTALRDLGDADRLSIHTMDLMDFATIDQLAKTLDGTPIDVLLSNGAITGTQNTAFGDTDYDVWADLNRANAMAPMKLAEVLADQVAASEHKTMFFISSRIGPTPNFGYVNYRATKSALSQVVLQIALALRDRGVIASCAHPGWVATKAAAGPGALAPDESAQNALADHYPPNDGRQRQVFRSRRHDAPDRDATTRRQALRDDPTGPLIDRRAGAA